MVRKKAPKNYRIAQQRLDQIPENSRRKIEGQLQVIQTRVNELLRKHHPFSGAFDIGQFLVAEQSSWKRKEQSEYWGYTWTDAERILNSDPTYKINLGRSILTPYRKAYQYCSPFLEKYPEIMDLCNQARVSALAKHYSELKKIAQAGDGQQIVDWLQALGTEETDLVESIRSRRDELKEVGIQLLDWTVFDFKTFFIGIPLPDLICRKGQIYFPVEVKDRECDCRAVGQVMAYVSKLREGSTFLDGHEISVRGLIMARRFHESTYSAALGQAITILKIDMRARPFLVDQIESDTMTKEQWNRFSQLRRVA